jgi:hypothetical protein
MEKKTVDLEIKNNLEDVVSSLKDVVAGLNKVADATEASEKATKDSAKATEGLAKGFSGVGLAIKAMGIGILMKGFEMLSEAFQRNQKVADALSAIFETISITLNQVTNIIVSVIEKVSKSSKGFEGLTAVIKGLLTIALTPLKLAFYGVGLAIAEIQLLWENSMFGDKDPKQVKVLTERIKSFSDGIKETGKEAVEAGKFVAKNMGKAITEVGQVVVGAVDGISKINVKANYEQAKALVKIRKDAQMAVVLQQGVVEAKDREAELQRQIRDDTSKSIAERRKANDQLAVVLKEQEKAMKALAGLQVAAARAEVQALDNQENRVKVQEALNNVKAVEAQITGLQSEQKVNVVALAKEELDMQQAIIDGKSEVIALQKQYNSDSIKNDSLRLLAQKQELERFRKTELERLQGIINTANLGTQARVDAEREYNLKKQELDNALKAKDKEIKDEALNRQYAFNEQILNNEKSSFSARLEALDSENAIIKQREYASELERTQALKENTDKRLAIERLAYEGKRQLLGQTASLLGEFSNMLGQQTAEGKALAVAQATINAYLGISEVWKAKNIYPEPYGTAVKVASTVAVATSAFQNVQKILSVDVPGGGGGGSVPNAPTASAPSFNVVGTSGANQIAQTLGKDQPPVKAYVVSSDVTTQQSLDRNIVKSASLG